MDNGNITDSEKTPLTRHHSEIDVEDGDRRPKRTKRETCATAVTILASLLAMLLAALFLILPGKKSTTSNNEAPASNKHTSHHSHTSQLFDEFGRFIMEDYDARPTFSDFLPAVAGIYGKPGWTFYVNRGQGIASFGTKSKEYPIMQFQSANHAYQNTPLLGFRTFLQGSRGPHSFLTEPFSPLHTRFDNVMNINTNPSLLPKRFMYVGANEMQIRDIDVSNRIETNVTYFTLPEEDFGALVRRTTITNLDQQLPLTLSLLDGLARIEPAGGKLHDLLNDMGRTLEAWMNVYETYNDTLTMPYYRLSTEPKDTADVRIQTAGHYCLSFLEAGETRPSVLLPIVYDTLKVFGEDTMLLRPVELQSKTVGQILAEPQYGVATTSSAFAAVNNVTIAPGESITISTFFGKTDHLLNVPVIARRIIENNFVDYKLSRARNIISQITAAVETQTGDDLFDGHIRQMFLDNSLRGGMPVILGEVDDQAMMNNADEDERLKVYHLFSRKHGDLERDYNDFEIDPTFFSQGPGNFRDVAQNRRNDVIFNPRIGSFNVKLFLSLIQADGYGPLSIESVVFIIDDADTCERIAAEAVGHAEGHRAQREALAQMLHSGPFRPGQLFEFMEEQNIFLMISHKAFIDMVAAAAQLSPMAVYTTGYWQDHWTYLIDLIDTYLSIYPDGEEALLYDQQLRYFFSPGFVLPRTKKYVLSLSFDGKSKHVRQLNATEEVMARFQEQKKYIDKNTNWYSIDANWKHDSAGNIFQSSPIAKLFLLVTLKFATRDAYGMGIEYEGGRPGWNDAMNGLPGMVGSGMPETFELEVLLRYLLSVVSKYRRPFSVPAEIGKLVDEIRVALVKLGDVDVRPLNAKVPSELFEYWDTVASAREAYRESIETTFSGETTIMEADTVSLILRSWIKELDKGKARAMTMGTHGLGDDGFSGITPTYFAYNVTSWKLTGERNKDGHHFVMARAMEVRKFPLFLEGPVRRMKSVDNGEALHMYNQIRNSLLRDDDLKMYKISASLKGQSYDMGRMMAFAPGFLENESIWLHMSYKFMLEILRHDLFAEFFEEMTSGGMLPFMQPDRYGRSLMECSSFIVSSAFANPASRGRGFLARLSGSTAEFLSMWALLMIGPRPFYLDEDSGELRMQLIPAIPLWLFEGGIPVKRTKQRAPLTLSFKLFSSINVTYHNARGTELFRVSPDRYVVVMRDGTTFNATGPSLDANLAERIRRVVFVDSIDVYFDESVP